MPDRVPRGSMVTRGLSPDSLVSGAFVSVVVLEFDVVAKVIRAFCLEVGQLFEYSKERVVGF